MTSAQRNWLLPALVLIMAGRGAAQVKGPRTDFRVKYIAEGAVYIDGGRAAGLTEKMKLSVRRAEGEAAIELEIVAVAEASALCEIRTPNGAPRIGDTASLSIEDSQKGEILLTSNGARNYVQTVTFTDGDPLDEEVREYMPHPKLPEINRVRGRIGLEYNGILGSGETGMSSSQYGLVLRADITRIGGTYWNLSGYTRLRSQSRTTQFETLTDLLNRTYHLSLTYNSPKSPWVAGFGRTYLPWAASLSTLDGGYVARRLNKTVTSGVFAGSTPDPTSWNYNPERKLAGAFVNFEGGSYEGTRYTSTIGLAISRLRWKPEREFVFFETALSYKRYFSVFENLEVDRSHPTELRPTATGTSVARNFTTLRLEANKLLSFDFNYNYFRDFPTFDPRLVGTGLLDKLLFQGASGGVRLSLPRRVSVYTNLGRSNGSNDPKSTWNQMYGAAVTNILGTGIRGDYHYARFNSSFGSGQYHAVSASRQMSESLRVEAQAGWQNYLSALTTQTRASYVNGNADWTFRNHYFVGGGFTAYRGQTQKYNQISFTVGYRF